LRTVGNYELTHQHLSVYQKSATGIDGESQYHYTAALQMESCEYRLHLYFDEEDNIVDEPFLYKKVNNEFKLVNSDEYLESFSPLAKKHVTDVVQRLRI